MITIIRVVESRNAVLSIQQLVEIADDCLARHRSRVRHLLPHWSSPPSLYEYDDGDDDDDYDDDCDDDGHDDNDYDDDFYDDDDDADLL